MTNLSNIKNKSLSREWSKDDHLREVRTSTTLDARQKSLNLDDPIKCIQTFFGESASSQINHSMSKPNKVQKLLKDVKK